MKAFYFISILAINTVLHAQIVNIPDTNFKNALLNHNPVIDTNGDGEIQVSEAESFTDNMDVADKNITDLTGIEAFVALQALNCSNNNLSTLNISSNTGLIELHCNFNIINSLDLSSNSYLTSLNCSNNLLTELDVSANLNITSLVCCDNNLESLILPETNINTLQCRNNNLTSLDIYNRSFDYFSCENNNISYLDTSETECEFFYCSNNPLTGSLNMKSNVSFIEIACDNTNIESIDFRGLNFVEGDAAYLSAINNPYLQCVFVDDKSISVFQYWNIDTTTTIVETDAECDALSTSDNFSLKQIEVYPNPFKESLSIDFDFTNSFTILIYDVLGHKVRVTSKKAIDTKSLKKGLYILKIKFENGSVFTKKIVKVGV